MISVLIPHKDEFNNLYKVLNAMRSQTFTPFEIIIVDSSTSSLKLENSLKKELNITIIDRATESIFPGHARNLGAKMANGDLLAFLDCKTIPDKAWLQDSMDQFKHSKSDILLGNFVCHEEDWFSKTAKAAIFGNIIHSSIPGSIINKDKFEISGGFSELVRAGEDIDWINRLDQMGYEITQSSSKPMTYSGLPNNLIDIIKKWHLYSMENAKVNILATQKSIYFFFLLIFFLYIAYRWNYIFTGGNWDESPLFIPHLNTILWLTLASSYMALRCLILPLLRKESFSFLLPFNFIIVGLIGLVIDLSKIPGRIYGFWKIMTFRKKI